MLWLIKKAMSLSIKNRKCQFSKSVWICLAAANQAYTVILCKTTCVVQRSYSLFIRLWLVFDWFLFWHDNNFLIMSVWDSNLLLLIAHLKLIPPYFSTEGVWCCDLWVRTTAYTSAQRDSKRTNRKAKVLMFEWS